MLKMKEFDKNDHICFNYSKFSKGGKSPMIGTTFTGKTIVVDAYGIEVYFPTNEDEDSHYWLPCDYNDALFIAGCMEDPINHKTLMRLGFEFLS